MKKNTVKLTESQLHRVIKESVKRVLKEAYNDEDTPWLDGYDEMYDSMGRSGYADGKQGDVDYSWDLLRPNYGEFSEDDPESSVNPYPNYGYHNKERLHTLDRTKDYHSDWERGDHAYYQDGELYPSAEFTDSWRTRDDNHWTNKADDYLAQQDFKKKFSNALDKADYIKKANSRPLHRKGSLNRI